MQPANQTPSASEGFPLRSGRRVARIVLTYVVLASLWILSSDKVLAVLVSDPGDRISWSIAKGWGFVAVTALLLYTMIRKLTRQLEQQHHTILAGETKYRQIVNGTHEGVLVIDGEGRITYANLRMAEMLGLKLEELVGRKLTSFLLPEDLEDHQLRLRNRSQKISESYERRLLRRDGHVVWTLVSASPLLDGAGEVSGTLCMLADVTDRHRLEEQLRQTQKMEAVGQLAGGVAHDFNNILAAMLMHLELLKKDPSLSDRVRESLVELETEAKRAASLTRQLLLYSRRQVMQMKPLALNELLDGLQKMLRRLLGEYIQFVVQGAPDSPWIEADPGMIEQVIMNLSVNARDAMPKGGQLHLRVESVELSASDTVRSSEARAGKFACLVVSDSGCGMSEEVVSRAFEPFFTTKDVGKGTGLGLATVYGIVKQHRGWVEVESALGKGTTFRVFLPVTDSRPDHALPAPVGRSTAGTEKILLVEDEASLRRIQGKYLRGKGYEVVEAASGQEALARWEEHRGTFDLLLSDVVMPGGINGLDLAARLRHQKSELRLILCSGYSEDLASEEASKLKDVVYVAKPFAPEALASAVRRLLDRHKPCS